MARKAPSRRPVESRPAPVKPVYTKPRPAPPPAAATTGLLQLSFGRHAHGYGIAAAVAFLINAILLYNIPNLPPTAPLGYWDYTLWLMPAAMGAIASVDAVRLKREPYKRHYLSRHFAMSTMGMAL